MKPHASTARPANTVSVKLDPSDMARIDSLASAKKRTAHYLMKEAIHEYIQREESRLNFIRASEESAREFQHTGLHVMHDEFDAWLETWGGDNEQPMPACHK